MSLSFSLSSCHLHLHGAIQLPRRPSLVTRFSIPKLVANYVGLSQFSGDTTSLESAVEASSTEANLSVGYGPFAVSGSHKQSKSSSKTKMESTATGCK